MKSLHKICSLTSLFLTNKEAYEACEVQGQPRMQQSWNGGVEDPQGIDEVTQ